MRTIPHDPPRQQPRAQPPLSERMALVVAVLTLAVGVMRLPFGPDDTDARTDRGGTTRPIGGAITEPADATLNGTVRGVHTDAPIVGVTRLSLADGASISISGHLPGEQPGTRTFAVDGTRGFTLKGNNITLGVSTLIRGGEVRIEEESTTLGNVIVDGRVTLAAPEITTSHAGSEPTTRRDSVSFVADGDASLRIGGIGGDVARVRSVRWTDAPKTIRVRGADRSFTTWAGKATVRTKDRSFAPEFGALGARGFDATIVRGPGGVTVSGRGRVQQVYVDGEPQFWTTASCDLVQIREETAPGRELELTWAPRNTGQFDMLMRRIVPIGPAAEWMSLGLEGAPNEFGGEVRPYERGDTLGFRSGLAIRALLPPMDADRRDIGISVPHGTAPGTYDATVRIEGNFDAVIVPFEIIVREATVPSGAY